MTGRDGERILKNYEPMMSFDEEAAEVYDEMDRREDTMDTVAFLEQMAGDGPALELAIGTGRVALPLAARSIRVDGVDLSPAMVAKLRAKPGGDQISVTMGDFARAPVEGAYRLIYLVYNTLFNLLTQDDQVRCFENVAAHLTNDGVFVVEAYVPYVAHDQHVKAEAIDVDQVTLDVGRLDPVKQLYYESHVVLSREGVRLFPIVQRYAWPSELDLMARIAGLRLKERWANWTREPFTATSWSHVSVYGR
jgi:SAM-dependent methyltransferase